MGHFGADDRLNDEQRTRLNTEKQELLKEWIYVNKRTQDKHNREFSTIGKFFEDVFLPRGFPESVHADYVPYQIWDTVQAFASTILGTLTTHSIMRGVGVGESTATPLAAAITWILKDGTGMIGRIVFAWWNGPELDAQCKKWRLFADVLNDLAMGIELSLPHFSSYSTIVLCVSSVMKSLVGVAGGATRAAITQHQALDNNLADVSAKDGSQETCVNLVASLVGIFILSKMDLLLQVRMCGHVIITKKAKLKAPRMTDRRSFVGVYYVVLVAVHIYANYSAVRSLRFNTFNEDRLALVVKNFLTKSIVLSPDEINRRESVLLFRRPSKELCGFDIVMGGSLDKIRRSLNHCDDETSHLLKIVRSYREKKKLQSSSKLPSTSGMIFVDVKTLTIFVAFDQDIEPIDIVDSYFKAFLTGIFISMQRKLRPDIIRQAKTTSGPLSKLYRVSCESTRIAADKIIVEELVEWSKLLDYSQWIRERNLLPVGPYRSYWNPRNVTRDR